MANAARGGSGSVTFEVDMAKRFVALSFPFQPVADGFGYLRGHMPPRIQAALARIIAEAVHLARRELDLTCPARDILLATKEHYCSVYDDVGEILDYGRLDCIDAKRTIPPLPRVQVDTYLLALMLFCFYAGSDDAVQDMRANEDPNALLCTTDIMSTDPRAPSADGRTIVTPTGAIARAPIVPKTLRLTLLSPSPTTSSTTTNPYAAPCWRTLPCSDTGCTVSLLDGTIIHVRGTTWTWNADFLSRLARHTIPEPPPQFWDAALALSSHLGLSDHPTAAYPTSFATVM